VGFTRSGDGAPWLRKTMQGKVIEITVKEKEKETEEEYLR
jgi:hypothetical protein